MTRAEVTELLFRMPWQELKNAAWQARCENLGRHVFVRGLIEFSNVCRRNCLSSDAEITAITYDSRKAGPGSLFVCLGGGAGRTPFGGGYFGAAERPPTALPITLSVGEQPRSWYALWKEAGANRFLIRHETADARLYAALHPGYTLQQRRQAQESLADLGYELGTGFLVGVPGQKPESLADDILLTRDMKAAMCGVGPFIPQSATPLAHAPHGSIPLTLRVMAVLRLAAPWLNMPATTALASLDPTRGQQDGLEAGGNVLMPSFTPRLRQAAYRIYDGKARVDMDAVRCAIENARLTHTLPVPADMPPKEIQ